TRRDRTLASLAAETGISASTLSRLESGGRRATHPRPVPTTC
ncbi:helix-turn-helix transcriptional regulator, partial [Rathayibacter sp. AY1B4]